jgi:molecular chaperone DnaJ
VRTTRRTPLGTFSSTAVCSACGGRGKTIKNPCPNCRGSGAERHKVAIKSRIPAGIDDGQTVSMRGQGHAGANNGPSGDVHLTVSVRPHPLFSREGTAVHCSVPLTFAQAALGAELEIPTLDGRVKLSVPEGTQNDATFRLRGKGIPTLGGGPRGDQYVHVKVEVPRNLSRKQKQILQDFSSATDDGNHPQRKRFFDFMK